MTDTTKGIIAMLLCCTIWGLSGLFYKLVAHIPVVDVLAHRTIWSLVFFFGVVMATGRLARLKAALGDTPTRLRLGLAAILVSCNWGVFIFSIGAGFAVEASLGYYIFPFVAILLGVIFLGERPGKLQWAAIALAMMAVVTLTVGLGAAPWIALTLASTFGLYGLIKKRLATGPITSVTVEVLILSPLALGWLSWVALQGGAPLGQGLRDMVVLMLSGPMTGGPLILFAYATQRLDYATVGVLQFWNPTLQFCVGAFIFLEVITFWHGIALPMIWVAVALYVMAARRQVRAARKRSITAAGLS
jgi:chloramphenicol-sensitive protein RarD